MKIVNMIKLKEEFDYESLCRKLENQVDNLTAEVDRQQKLRENEKHKMEKQLRDCQASVAEAEYSLITRSEVAISPPEYFFKLNFFYQFFIYNITLEYFNILRVFSGSYFENFFLMMFISVSRKGEYPNGKGDDRFIN